MKPIELFPMLLLLLVSGGCTKQPHRVSDLPKKESAIQADHGSSEGFISEDLHRTHLVEIMWSEKLNKIHSATTQQIKGNIGSEECWDRLYLIGRDIGENIFLTNQERNDFLDSYYDILFVADSSAGNARGFTADDSIAFRVSRIVRRIYKDIETNNMSKERGRAYLSQIAKNINNRNDIRPDTRADIVTAIKEGRYRKPYTATASSIYGTTAGMDKEYREAYIDELSQKVQIHKPYDRSNQRISSQQSDSLLNAKNLIRDSIKKWAAEFYSGEMNEPSLIANLEMIAVIIDSSEKYSDAEKAELIGFYLGYLSALNSEMVGIEAASSQNDKKSKTR